MSLDDEKMYNQARNVSEPLLVEALKKSNFTDIRQTTKKEDLSHKDVIAKIDGIEYQFDVKDLTEKYLTSRNYSMSEHMYNAILKDQQKYENHRIACREYKNSIPTGKFIIVKSVDAAAVSHIKQNTKTGKRFRLFNIDECIKKFKTATI